VLAAVHLVRSDEVVDRRLARLLVIGLCSALIGQACGGRSPSAPSNPTSPPTLLVISAPWSKLVAGDSEPIYADAQFADGSIVEGLKGVTWALSDSRVGSMSGNLFAANAPGEVDVRGTYLGVTAHYHLTVIAAIDLREVRVTDTIDDPIPPVLPFELVPGFHRQLYAVAVFPDGSHEVISNLALWGSSDTAIAVASDGDITAVKPGVTAISATYHGHSGNVVVTVKPTHPGQDALQSLGGYSTGGLRPGDITTFSETLSYNVVSAPSGRITFLMTDQDGTPIGSSPPPAVDVGIGAGAVTVGDTFVIPTGARALCSEVTLVIRGSTRPPVTTGRRCDGVRGT
jgi:hypothetical protein